MKISLDGGINAAEEDVTKNTININKTSSGTATDPVEGSPTAGTVIFDNNVRYHTINMYAGTLKVGSGSYLDTNTLNLNGGTLNLANGKIDTISLEDFSSANGSKINFDADLTNYGTGFGKSDNISVNGTASGTLAINSINIITDGEAEHITLFNDSKSPTLSALKTYTNDYIYTFSANKATAGVVDIERQLNLAGVGGLHEAVKDTTATRSFSATADVVLDKSLEPMGGTTLNIFGNEKNFDGNGFKGFEIAEGQEVNIYNAGSIGEDGTVKTAITGFGMIVGEDTKGTFMNNAGTATITDSVIGQNEANYG